MLGFRTPDPDQAMLISGGKIKADAEGQRAPFRVIVGHRKFVLPGFNKVDFLTLSMQEAEVSERCVTQQGILLGAKAVVAFKVGPTEEMIVAAGQRFLSDQTQMPVLTGRIFAGHLRSIVGSMTVEQIVKERQTLAGEVLDASAGEMSRIGLLVDSFQIQSIDDRQTDGTSYIDLMSAPHRAAIRRDAQIAQAQADQASAQAAQESQRKQMEFQRETTIAQANNQSQQEAASAEADRQAQIAQAQAASAVAQAQAEQTQAAQLAQAHAKQAVAVAEAEASQAGSLAQATAQQDVAKEQTELARINALRVEQELQATVVKPAEADAEKTRTAAKADADATRARADAAASSNRVTLDQRLIEVLPELVANAAQGLQGSNLTVLNGSDGLRQVLAGLASDGMAIYQTLREQTQSSAHGNGQEALNESTESTS